jgi:hypothetical protein
MSETERHIRDGVPFLVGEIFDGIWVAVCQGEAGGRAGASEDSAEDAVTQAELYRNETLTSEIAEVLHEACAGASCASVLAHLSDAELILNWCDKRRWHPYIRESEANEGT